MNRHEDKVLELFYYEPMTQFGIRQLSRKTQLDTKTIMKYLKELTRKKIIKKYHKKGKFPHFEANRLSRTYRYQKSHALITKILQSGLIEELEKLKPKTITIFGSAKKGTYHKKSDIDIFIQTKPKKINLTKYEHKLKHKINLLFEENLKNLTPGLLENIYNGETISGKLEVTT